MSASNDVWYRSRDGLRLYARDYPHAAPRATVLCLHGLSRNSADFEELATLLNADHRVIVPDQRGRGRSERDPQPARYQPPVYVQDMFTLLDELRVPQVAAIGTSLGGMMLMLMAALRPGCLRAAVLNDIGPVLDTAGVARIRGYAGKIPSPASWAEAAAQSRAINGAAFPDYKEEDWLRMAQRTYRETADGRLEQACDPNISVALADTANSGVPADLWPAFAALREVPTLLIRGALSDILSAGCAREMRQRKPDLRYVELPGRGHSPALDEPPAVAAILELLRSI